MLHFDVLRGEDSTGLCAVHKVYGQGNPVFEPKVYKSVGLPQDLYDDHPEVFVKDEYAPVGVVCLMGHNRYKTQGEVNVDNAHPFEFDNLIGAHNGTLVMNSLKELNGYGVHDVDSKIIFNHLSDTGNLQEVWDKANGAMALTWWDKQTNTLKIVRNGQRTLFYCYSHGGTTMFWASEGWMLQVALTRAGIQHSKIESFDINKLYTFTQGAGVKIVKEETPLIPFVQPPVTSNVVSYSWPKSKRDSLLKLTQYVQEGPKKWQGYFVGEDVHGMEIVLLFEHVQERVQKYRYERIIERYKTGNPFWLYDEYDLQVEKGYLFIEYFDVTESPKYLPKGADPVKDIPAKVVQINNENLTEKMFEEKFSEGCFCGQPIKFEEAAEATILDGVLICKECAQSPLISDYLKEAGVMQ